MFKKSLTLLELILAVVLLAMVILSAASLDVASLEFFKSSDRKAVVLNEVSSVKEYVQKSALQAHGWINNPGFGIIDAGDGVWFRLDHTNTPADFSDDSYVWYKFDSTTNQIELCDSSLPLAGLSVCPGTSSVLSRRIESCVFSYPADSTVIQVEITGIYDPAGPVDDERENPHVQMRSQFFLGSHSFR
jgi:hypothetical protein